MSSHRLTIYNGDNSINWPQCKYPIGHPKQFLGDPKSSHKAQQSSKDTKDFMSNSFVSTFDPE